MSNKFLLSDPELVTLLSTKRAARVALAMDSDTAKIYIKKSKIQGVSTWYPQKLLPNFQNQRYSPLAQDSQVNEKRVIQRVAENLDA